MIEDSEATGFTKEMYDKARSPHGTVDNVMRCQSLRPHTIAGHMAIYKSVLHNPENVLPFWFLEVVASYTSIINECLYSLSLNLCNREISQLQLCISGKYKECLLTTLLDSRQLFLT